MRYIALDVDGTIMRSNVSVAFGRFLYEIGQISFLQALSAAVAYALFYVGIISVEKLHTLIFRLLFFRKEVSLIEKAADQFFLVKAPHLFQKKVCKEIEVLQQEDAHLAILSSSPDFLVKRVAQFLHIDEWHATEYRTDEQGHFVALGSVVTGQEKRNIVRKKRDDKPLHITVFTDSILDLPLIDQADQVVAVCPDRRLCRLAYERGWRILAC